MEHPPPGWPAAPPSSSPSPHAASAARPPWTPAGGCSGGSPPVGDARHRAPRTGQHARAPEGTNQECVCEVCACVWCVGMCVVCGYVCATCPHHFLQPFIENVIGTVTLRHLLGQVFPLLLLLFQLLHQQPQLPLHLFLLQKDLFQALLPLFPVHLDVALVLTKTEIL